MYLIDDDENHIGIANGVWHKFPIDGGLRLNETMAQVKTHHNNSSSSSNNGEKNLQKQYRQRFTFNSHEHKLHVAEELIFFRHPSACLLVQS